MSMKRSKQAPKGRRSDSRDDSSGVKKTATAAIDWEAKVANQPDADFMAYDINASFAKGALIKHDIFGKGLVTQADRQRIEVVFQEGAKKLAHKGLPQP